MEKSEKEKAVDTALDKFEKEHLKYQRSRKTEIDLRGLRAKFDEILKKTNEFCDEEEAKRGGRP